MNSKTLAIVVLTACLFSLVPFACGQGTDLGTIRGVVTDTSGSVVPNAAITITDTATSAVRQTKSNGDGEYEVFGLRPGVYNVSVQQTGFATGVSRRATRRYSTENCRRRAFDLLRRHKLPV